MAIEIKDFIKILQEKEQDVVVEFVVVKTNGELICMDIEKKSHDLIKLMEMFGR